jgi:hypothetical protein
MRYDVFALDAQLGSWGRRKILRLSAKGNLRQYPQMLIERGSNFDEYQLQCSWMEI